MSNFSAIMLTIGTMIGSAIFTLSGVTIFNSGFYSVFAWIAAAIISLLYGKVLINLVSKYPSISAITSFASTSFKLPFFSKFASLLYLYGCLAGLLFSLLSLSDALKNYIPLDSMILSILIILFVTILVFLGLKVTSIVQISITILLIIGILIFSTFFFLNTNTTPSLTFDALNFGQSIPIAILGFGAIVMPAFLAKEIKSGKVKFVMYLSLIITTILYLIIIFATMFTTSLSEYEKYSPVLTAVTKLGNNPVILIIVNVSIFVALLSTIIGLFYLSKTSISVLGVSSDKKSSIIVFGICLVTIVLYSKIEVFVNSGALTNLLFMASVCISGIVLLKNKILPIVTLILVIACCVPNILQNLTIQISIPIALAIIAFILSNILPKVLPSLKE